MRKHLVTKITELMDQDQSLIFLTGDLGFGSFEILQEKFPDRFYNMGIAEQNMIGVACGLSLAGKKVVVYSIANFSTLRVVEQIRNYPIYHNCHVLIVNGGAAFSYGQLGYTHHAVEDVSIIKSLPQIKVYAPFNQATVENTIDQWYASPQTAYLRLEKGEINTEEGGIAHYPFGNMVGEPNANNYIIGYGTILEEALQAKKALKENNIDVTVVALHDLKQIEPSLYDLINGKRVLFIEENSIHGGVGEHFFATCLINGVTPQKAMIYGVKDFISETIGDQKYLRKIHNLTSGDVVTFFQNKY